MTAANIVYWSADLIIDVKIEEAYIVEHRAL